MIERRLKTDLEQIIHASPAVLLLGPRQVGKTTLARLVASEIPSVYLDMESDTDRAKLDNTEAYLRAHEGELVILDEVHRMPDIFRTLRSLIDEGIHSGKTTGRFLLLGSASLDLLRQTDESLAGRVAHLELAPFDALEIGSMSLDTLSLRGGFPKSYLAASDEESMRWRRDFIQSYLERDIPQFGIRIPAETLRRFLTMLAHHQSGILNASALARNLAVDGKTIAHHIDLLIDLLLVRRLPSWSENVGKRLTRSPKLYIRDTGLVHALLNIPDRETLLGHPIVGASWEGFVVEQLLGVAPSGTDAHFYRTATGDEIDLVLDLPKRQRWAIEIKSGGVARASGGFHRACASVQATKRFIVYTGQERYPLGNDTEAIPLVDLMNALSQQ